MGIYAARPGRLVGQLVGDVFVAVWGVIWGVVGTFVHAGVSVLAAPARETARTATRLSADLSDAATQAATVPGVGEQLRRPFDAASTTLSSLVASANHQVDSIERLALLLGWLVFLIPVSVIVAFWLPRRIRFYRRAKASQQFLDSSADLDLFALRAMTGQPLHVLAGISDDPVRDWRAGNREVIDRLAELELRQSGLRRPDRLSVPSDEPPGPPDLNPAAETEPDRR